MLATVSGMWVQFTQVSAVRVLSGLVNIVNRSDSTVIAIVISEKINEFDWAEGENGGKRRKYFEKVEHWKAIHCIAMEAEGRGCARAVWEVILLH